MKKLTVARLSLGGDKFEILVHPDEALAYKMGKKVDLDRVLASFEVYTDSSKGLRAANEKLLKRFYTTDFRKIAETILKKGELQITSEQRRRLLEEKRKRIVNLISKNFVDPKTNLPHPPLRIERALEEAKVSIDPFKDAEEQMKGVVEQLRRILPLKSGRVKLLVRVPARYAGRSYGVLKEFGDVIREDWGTDGGLTAVVNIPVAVRGNLVEKLGSITKGEAQIELVE